MRKYKHLRPLSATILLRTQRTLQKSLLLTVMLLASLAASAESIEIDGLYYELDEENATATVAKNPETQYSGDIVIPEKVTCEDKEYTVTAIGTDAFYYAKDLTSISIPNTVTIINESAFNSCENLTSIELPNAITTISRKAFSDCVNLTSIKLPNAITTISEEMFRS